MLWFNKKTESTTAQTTLAKSNMFIEKGHFDEAFKLLYDAAADSNLSSADIYHNLGALYATGKGTQVDYVSAAYWFNKAEALGKEASGKLVIKSLMDFMVDMLNANVESAQFFASMENAIERIFPNVKSSSEKAANDIYSLGAHFFNTKRHAAAAKLFHISARHANHAESQNMLGVMYNIGSGVESNDLVALYWFDKAADNGLSAAKQDRDGIFNAYKHSLDASEFKEYMALLSSWCKSGTEEIPVDSKKAAFWSQFA